MSEYNGLGWPVNNDIHTGDIYPDLGMNATTGDFATGATDSVGNLTPTADTAAPVASNAKPLNWWIAMIVLFIILIFVARHLHGEESFAANFKQIKPSVFNVLLITLVVIIGLPLIKIGAAYIPNQSLKAYILAV